jgi:hypothetical protein
VTTTAIVTWPGDASIVVENDPSLPRDTLAPFTVTESVPAPPLAVPRTATVEVVATKLAGGSAMASSGGPVTTCTCRVKDASFPAASTAVTTIELSPCCTGTVAVKLRCSRRVPCAIDPGDGEDVIALGPDLHATHEGHTIERDGQLREMSVGCLERRGHRYAHDVALGNSADLDLRCSPVDGAPPDT